MFNHPKTFARHFWQVFKLFNILLVLLVAVFFIPIHPAYAHRPHDVVEQVELSPQFDQDKTLFILVRNNLFKSVNAGDNWSRIVNGIDARGNFQSLSISPQNKNIMFLGTLSDGVYRSEDEGKSWSRVNNGLKTLNIFTLEVSPKSSDVVLAAGTDKGLYQTKVAGLYQTQDGGKNWVQVLNDNIKITQISFFPSEANKVLVGDSQGNIYLSEDNGKNWQVISNLKDSGSITAFAFLPNNTSNNTFFVGTEKGGIFKTSDRGKSFEAINQGLADKIIEDIIISPNYSQDSTLYASTWYDGVVYSKNGGKTWQKHGNGLTKDDQADQLKLPHFSDLKLADRTMFVAGFNGLFRSFNKGQDWQEIETLSKGTITALAVSPNYENDSTLVAVNYVENVFMSRDKGETWMPITKGLERPRFTNDREEAGQDPRRFFDVAFSPNYAVDRTLFASVLWSKIIKSSNSGDNWKLVPLPLEARGIKIVPSPSFADDRTVYLISQEGYLFKSTNNGDKFSKFEKLTPIFGNDTPSMVASPNFANDNTLFTASKKGIYKTIDGGEKWQLVTEGNTFAKRVSLQLAISPNYKNDRTVFVGTHSDIFVTKDGGKTWQKSEKTPFDSNSWIEGVALSPNYQNDRTLIVIVRGKGLYKSVDRGETFQPLGDPSLPISKINSLPHAGVAIQFSPSYATDNTLFGFGGATSLVYKSTDGGNTWKTITIPKPPEKEYDFWTLASIYFQIYRSHLWRIIASLIAAIVIYILLGYLNLEKKLPLNKALIKALGAFLTFVIGLLITFNL